MHMNASLFRIARSAAALSLVAAATLMHAQQVAKETSSSSAVSAPLLLASAAAPSDFFSSMTPSYSSSSLSADLTSLDAASHLDLGAASQPPPRRRYGRPNYSDSHTNPDGSSKYAFLVGVGAALPVGNTHTYFTPSYGFQAGFGRNFNKNASVVLQFDYDHLGLQGNTLNNQETVYNYGCTAVAVANGYCTLVTGLDGNNHIWSFTLNPTYTLSTIGSLGAYGVVGFGFYHKVTNFTLPETSEAYSPYYGYYQYTAEANVDHYTSNGVGVNGGIGLTYKFSRWANERLYAEARYVVMFNSQRTGYTAANVATTTYDGYNAFPANSNRTAYVPIKVGLRF